MDSSLHLNGPQRLNMHEMARLSAMAINTPDYVNEYMNDLISLIPCRDSKIVDTACGIGFPSIELLKRGYSNITACDADGVALDYFRSKLSEQQSAIRTVQCSWDLLPECLNEKFDIVLNVGHSFVYMDGWAAGADIPHPIYCSQWNNIQDRSIGLLQKFRDLLNIGGKSVIGLAKHYERGRFSGSFDEPLSCFIQPVSIGGSEVDLEWTSHMDWENRTHVWTTRVITDLYFGEAVRKSYLVTKEEIASFMSRAGFTDVNIIESRHARDNFIIGTK